jgi:hypothetical protein
MTSYCKRTAAQRIALVLVAAVSWLVSSRWAVAADPPAKQGERSQAEKARRETVLKSEPWRNTMKGLDQWYSVQTMYNEKQIDEIKKQIARRVDTMSAGELDDFRQELDTKLTMLLSPEGREILAWVAANLAAASPAYRKKMDIQYPDVARLSAAELREQLDLLTQKRSAAQTQTAALERARQARIAGLQAEQRQEAQERQQALSRPPATIASPYHPGGMRQYPDVVSQNQFGWGFGFW